MHIGVLTHNYPRFAGDFSGVFVAALCREFARQAHGVTVWAPFDMEYDPARDPAYARGQVYPQTAPQPGAIDLRLYRYAWPDKLNRLGYMRTMHSDLALRLEAYALSPGLFGAGILTVMRQAARLRPQVLHAHWALPNGFIDAVVARRLGIPLVVSIPGSDAQVAGQNPLFRAMARFTFRQADLLTANSEALRDAVVALGADPGKFELIIYGTDPAALTSNPEGTAELAGQLEIPPAAPIFLCVGRMVAKKGFDVFLRALAHPRLAQLGAVGVMVGRGDELEAWKRLAGELGIQARVRWAGVVPNHKIGVYYNLADALVMPSVSKPADGLNVCVLDAMSCAKPVVGSVVAGNQLAIVHDETGLITPEGDVDALADALIRLAEDRDLAQRMGTAGRRRIETELGWPHLARRHVEHFERLAGVGRDCRQRK